MASSGTFVIVGAGMAGAMGAEALREQGFEGRLVLLGDEPELPYERPPLSKDYLLGSAPLESARVFERDWYEQHDVELRRGVTVGRLDRYARTLHLPGGELLDYDRLLLTTGARPRVPPLGGGAAAGVHTLRSTADAERLRPAVTGAEHLVVLGAGWIGLEVAAAARQHDVPVTVVEQASLPLSGALGPENGEVFADLHRQHGVAFRFGTSAVELRTSGNGPTGEHRVTGVRLSDGDVLAADAVLLATGVEPNTEVAASAELRVDDGIAVDESLRTSDPNVFAAGDVANAHHPLLGRSLRVEHWANAGRQPAVAAAGMLGRQARYDALPYFFTDQYDLGMEFTGHVTPREYDRVVFRGDVSAREYVAFWLREGRVQAGMNVNVWDVGEQIEALVRSGAHASPDRLADPDVPLAEIAGA
ncbi:FAD-dependent oxidoreductase [Salinifilum aidingensis]